MTVCNRATDEQHSTSLNGITSLLSVENIEKLQSIMYPMNLKAGAYLFWEGDPAGKLFYIRSGKVKLRKSTEEGKDFILSIMHKGDLLGEFGGTGELFYSFSAEVLEDAEIGIIQIKDLEVLLYQNGFLAVEFMHWLGLMHRTTQSKFRDLLLFGKPGALASTLIRMSNSFGIQSADGLVINVKFTNTEIADMIGTARESVNRMLGSWKDDGTICMQNGQIVIQRIDNLRRICNCPSYPGCPKEICRI